MLIMSRSKIPVYVDNRIAPLRRPYDEAKLLPYLSYSNPVYSHMLRTKPWYRKCRECKEYPNTKKNPDRHDDDDHEYVAIWDGKKKFLIRDTLPAGLFWSTYRDIEKKEHIRFKVKSKHTSPKTRSKKHWLLSEGKYLFQNDCAIEMYSHAIMGMGGLVLNATGSGKTRTAAMIASMLDCEILFVVDQLVLLKQAQSAIAKHLGEKIGYVGEAKFHLDRVTIATIQTLHLHRKDPKFLKWLRNVDVVIIDELHEMLSHRNFDVINITRPLSTFGLTATLALSRKPVRLKAYALCGPVIYQYPVQTGMKEGVLSKGICIQLRYENILRDIDGWNQREAYDTRIVSNGERNHLISSLVRRAVKKNKYVIVVVDRLKHIEEITSRLRISNVKYRVVAGTYKGKGISVETRFKRKDDFEAGKVKVLVVNKVMKKGIDIKRVDLIINASCKPSANDAIQVFGRGVRLHKDKKGLICIDI